MAALWDHDQLEWLRAMGHEVLVIATPSPGVSSHDAASAPRNATAVPSSDADASPLSRALLRACLNDPAGLQALGLEAARLRGDAAAKRAAWPTLRAWRRQAR